MTLAAPAVHRSDHLHEVLRALYPPPHSLQRDIGDLVAEYRLVPHRRRPRLLVPADRRLVAAGLRSVAPAGYTARLGLRVGAAVPAVAGLLLRDTIRVYGPPGSGHFGGHLSVVLGVDPLHLAIHVGGPARTNRKPVVALLDAAGDTVGFAKLGTNPLSDGLIRNERAALRTLGNSVLRRTRIPALLHGGRWAGHEVIVQSALPLWQPAVPGRDLLIRAMSEVALACGSHRGRLADAAYWTGLRARVSETDDERLAAAAERVQRRYADLELEFGAWHGDWSPWNSLQLADGVLVWDWERFAVGVPLGFDALHHRLTSAIDGPSPEQALSAPGDLLAPFGVTAEQAAATTALYLIEIGTRYLADGHRTAAARTVTERLLPRILEGYGVTGPGMPDGGQR